MRFIISSFDLLLRFRNRYINTYRTIYGTFDILCVFNFVIVAHVIIFSNDMTRRSINTAQSYSFCSK